MFINTSGLAITFACIYYLLSIFFDQFNQGPAVLPTGQMLYLLEQQSTRFVSELSSSRLGCLQASLDLCILSLLRLNGAPGKVS